LISLARQTRAEARQAVFAFVECFYNRVRRHSSIEYVSPVAFEQIKS
jgi:putative transposase